MSRLQNQLESLSELDELIGLYTRTETEQDGAFIEEFEPAPTATIRAKVRYIRTEENDSILKQEKFTQEIKVHIRPNSSVTIEHYVWWDSKWWDVYALEKTPAQRFFILKARLIET